MSGLGLGMLRFRVLGFRGLSPSHGLLFFMLCCFIVICFVFFVHVLFYFFFFFDRTKLQKKQIITILVKKKDSVAECLIKDTAVRVGPLLQLLPLKHV